MTTTGSSGRALFLLVLRPSNSLVSFINLCARLKLIPSLVDFDTGSSDIFVPGSDCDSTCSGHTLYDASESSTAQDTGESFELGFGDGSAVSGEQFTDTVTLGGLTATDQRIGAAGQLSGNFDISRFPPDGLVGMAFEEISNYGSPYVSSCILLDMIFTLLTALSFKLWYRRVNWILENLDSHFLPMDLSCTSEVSILPNFLGH